ncbi:MULTISPECIES: response regulator [unclassified Caballeronia]|uniref:response regulator n=1 Tax=unclassified Caballeronia TaxID=2646786 RepID=UPI002858A690|nr:MULTISPECIES: response regulator [unclassified Caballeronia]MDR5740658.1 response regulator [Caballeronia sp. LZ016]MDR5808818.1 response regulator [Caballeronia sp. LZ019]
MHDLHGVNVLVVEDERAIAMLMQDMLELLGCGVVDCVSTLHDACARAQSGSFDVAILDVNLGGHPVYAAAEILRTRGIPFVFSTGYGHGGVSNEFHGVPILAKPFAMTDLERTVASALAAKSADGA